MWVLRYVAVKCSTIVFKRLIESYCNTTVLNQTANMFASFSEFWRYDHPKTKNKTGNEGNNNNWYDLSIDSNIKYNFGNVSYSPCIKLSYWF